MPPKDDTKAMALNIAITRIRENTNESGHKTYILGIKNGSTPPTAAAKIVEHLMSKKRYDVRLFVAIYIANQSKRFRIQKKLSSSLTQKEDAFLRAYIEFLRANNQNYVDKLVSIFALSPGKDPAKDPPSFIFSRATAERYLTELTTEEIEIVKMGNKREIRQLLHPFRNSYNPHFPQATKFMVSVVKAATKKTMDLAKTIGRLLRLATNKQAFAEALKKVYGFLERAQQTQPPPPPPPKKRLLPQKSTLR